MTTSCFNISDNELLEIIKDKFASNGHHDMQNNKYGLVDVDKIYEIYLNKIKKVLTQYHNSCIMNINYLLNHIDIIDDYVDIETMLQIYRTICSISSLEDYHEHQTTRDTDLIENIILGAFNKHLDNCNKIESMLKDIMCNDMANVIVEYIKMNYNIKMIFFISMFIQ